MAKKYFNVEVDNAAPTYVADAIQNGETVYCMLLEKTYDSGYLKELEINNSQNKAKNEAMGMSYVPTMPNHKYGGLSWKYAIVLRRKLGEKEDTQCFLDDGNGNLIEPNYTVYGQITQNVPKRIFEKPIYGNHIIYGEDSPNTMKLEMILPNPLETAIWKEGTKLYNVSDIPDELRDNYTGYIERELNRLKNWEQFIKAYEAWDESTAYEWLDMCLASRYCIGHKDENNKFIYEPLKAGLIFQAQVWRYKPDGKYLDLRAYEAKTLDVTALYTNFNPKYSPGNELMAKDLLALRNTRKAVRQVSAEDEEKSF